MNKPTKTSEESCYLDIMVYKRRSLSRNSGFFLGHNVSSTKHLENIPTFCLSNIGGNR